VATFKDAVFDVLENDDLVRFVARIERDRLGCWVWMGGGRTGGYGAFNERVPGGFKPTSAHRSAYRLFVGPIPEGLVLDHLCRNRRCVNPDHLEAVAQLVNIRRGFVGGSTSRTRCKNGHEFAGDNLVLSEKQQVCRTCRNARALAHYYRKRERSGHI
jgi:hypothetical protein